MRVVGRIGDEKGVRAIPDQRVHAWVLQAPKASGSSAALSIRKKLLELQDLRDKADYEPWSAHPADVAQEAISLSERFIDNQIDKAPSSLFENLPL